jgi:hypothetical protein
MLGDGPSIGVTPPIPNTGELGCTASTFDIGAGFTIPTTILV